MVEQGPLEIVVPANVDAAERLERLLQSLERESRDLRLRQDAAGPLGATISTHPAGAIPLAIAGLCDLQAHRFEAAEQALAAAVTQGLDNCDVRYHLALARAMQSRWADAVSLLSDAALQKGSPPALVLLARCLHHLQRTDDAMAACQARLAATSTDAEAHGLLALLLQECGRSQEALMHIDAALALVPLQREALLAREWLQGPSAQTLDQLQ